MQKLFQDVKLLDLEKNPTRNPLKDYKKDHLKNHQKDHLKNHVKVVKGRIV